MFKAKDLRERSVEELRELEKSLAGDAFQARFKNFTNRLDNTASIKAARRDLARVKTLIVERAKGLTPVAAEKPAKAEKTAAAPKAAKAPKAAESKPAKKTTAKKTTAKAEAK
jgi:large subunit ribosomal protein L29